MAEQVKEENQKTVVSFVVGLLVGGLLVWAFTGTPNDAPKHDDAKTDDKAMTDEKKPEATKTENVKSETPTATTLPTSDAAFAALAQVAAMKVDISNATFPIKEGWIGVRDYSDGKLGGILGVMRFSDTQGLIPKEVVLQRPTKAGQEYAIVFFTEDGDRKFNSAADVQVAQDPIIFSAK